MNLAERIYLLATMKTGLKRRTGGCCSETYSFLHRRIYVVIIGYLRLGVKIIRVIYTCNYPVVECTGKQDFTKYKYEKLVLRFRYNGIHLRICCNCTGNRVTFLYETLLRALRLSINHYS